MKRLLFLAMNLNSGGAERQMVTVARALKRRGYDISFVCYASGGFFYPLLRELSIPVSWLINNSLVKRVLSIRSFIRNGRYDAVISFLDTPNIINLLSGIGRRNWKVITGERSSKITIYQSFRGKVTAWLQRFADVLICNSENAANLLRTFFPKMKVKIDVIYNIVDIPVIDSNIMRSNSSKIRFLIAASYQKLKNPINVIYAIAGLTNQEKESIIVDWYGSQHALQSEYHSACSLVESLSLQRVINLNGPSINIYQEMMNSDVIGLFSSVEGLPNAICEGMMLGKPVIMTRVSDYNNLVDSTNGFLCEWDNIESIRDAFRKMIHLSRPEREKLGVSSKDKAFRFFAEGILIEKWISVIE